MQYVAFHMQHFKENMVRVLCDEGQRKINHTADGRINFDKSSSNYQAGTGEPMDGKDYMEKIDKLLQDNGITKGKRGKRTVYLYSDGRAVRKDSNILTGIVLTVDRETAFSWGEKNTRAYFQAAVYFLKHKFGNCIDDVVHVDEEDAGIHMHFYAVSMKKDKHDIMRLNTRELWQRKWLRQLHTDLAAYLQGLKYPVVRGLENSGILYQDKFRSRKKIANTYYLRADEIAKAVDRVRSKAVVREVGTGFLGMGAKEEKVELPLEEYKELVTMARDSAKAIEELERNRIRMDQSRKLAQMKKEKAALNESLKAVEERIQEKDRELRAEENKRTTAVQEATDRVYRNTLVEVKQKYGEVIGWGNYIKPVLQHADLRNKLIELVKNAKGLEQAEGRAKAEDKQKKRTRNNSRDDDSLGM